MIYVFHIKQIIGKIAIFCMALREYYVIHNIILNMRLKVDVDTEVEAVRRTREGNFLRVCKGINTTTLCVL